MILGRICGEYGRLKTFGVLVEGILRTTNIFVQGIKRWGIEGIYREKIEGKEQLMSPMMSRSLGGSQSRSTNLGLQDADSKS